MKLNTYRLCTILALSIALHPILVMAMNVNAMVVNTQVSVLKLDTNVFKQQLNTHALAPHFQTVLNDGVNKDIILKYYPCLKDIDQSQFNTFKTRLERVLVKKISAVDRRFSMAAIPATVAFTDDMKAIASAKLVLKNSGKFTFQQSQLINVAKLGKDDIFKVKKIDLTKSFVKKIDITGLNSNVDSGAAAEAVEDVEEAAEGGPGPAVFSVDEKSFRGTIGDHEQLFCEVYHDGKWKKIISAVSYLHTPCHELNVPKVKLDSEDEEKEDEKAPAGGGCSVAKWKWHVIDLGWKLSLANGLIKDTRRFDLLQRADFEKTIYDNHKLNLGAVPVAIP
ncbi:MAG: hypothetical protein AABY86_00630 [Bdellovibrionota bacterium]